MQCFDFFLTKSCHWHLNKFLLDFRKNSIFQWKTSWWKIFWLPHSGIEMEGDCRRNKCYGFSAWGILGSLTLSIWGSMGQKLNWYWDTYSHAQPGTSFLALDNSYGVPVTCPALLCWETNTHDNPEILWNYPAYKGLSWKMKFWWSPAQLGLGAAVLAH